MTLYGFFFSLLIYINQKAFPEILSSESYYGKALGDIPENHVYFMN